ncbi:unnamed protein product [Pleuronectes platessa]|uniref:Uncharacterized protein n=1 Tax=Pleuronectes platessa TaxID=8262 RepID=A0A9N7TP14_PLEPL|nr:unnamed protein product [Pleuronectes platessa]
MSSPDSYPEITCSVTSGPVKTLLWARKGGETGPVTGALLPFPPYLHEEQFDTFCARLLECENCTGRRVWRVDGLSVLIQTLREWCEALEKKKEVPKPPGLERKRARDVWELDFYPTGKSESPLSDLCLGLEAERCVTLRLASRPNRLTVRYVHIVTLEGSRLSGQKQNGPQGLSCLSRLLATACVCTHVCAQTWLLMKWGHF